MMARSAAFLRAINVGGHAVVKMSDLEKAFTDAGCSNVKTVLQSGNVVFDMPEDNPAGVLERVKWNLAGLVGTETTVLFRKMEDLHALTAESPFGNEPASDNIKWYVTFLSQRPVKKPPMPIVSPKDGLDLIGMRGLDVFIISRGIRGRYGFPNLFVEKEFGVPATSRNWTTILRIMKLFT
jgi:uncharacterized protein (DUF1697 family)